MYPGHHDEIDNAVTSPAVPTYGKDIFDRDGIVEPYPHYRTLRELGGAVFLSQQSIYAIPRYDGVKRALSDAETFISSKGVAVSDEMNTMLTGSIITSDGEAHAAIRAREAPPLMPPSLDPLREYVRTEAKSLIRRLAGRSSFDAVTDLAQYLPVQVVAELVGLPERGRENMLEWSASIFQLIGPLNSFSQAALADCGEMFNFIKSLDPAEVKPGSWSARIFAMVDEGTIDREEAGKMVVDLIGPALDTTLFGIGHMIRLFGQHNDQWQLLRNRPELVGSAVDEVLRLESPIRGFTRYSTRDADFDGVCVPAGSRLLLLYASANRDDRFWGTDAEQMDVSRSMARRQLAFGYGRHSCIGMHLARLEMSAILEAMLEFVDVIEVGEPEMALITSLRGIKSMSASFTKSPSA